MKVLMAGKKHSNIKDLKEKAVCQNFFSSIPDQMPLNTVTQIFQRVNVTLEGFAWFYLESYTTLHHPVIKYGGQIEK